MNQPRTLCFLILFLFFFVFLFFVCSSEVALGKPQSLTKGNTQVFFFSYLSDNEERS